MKNLFKILILLSVFGVTFVWANSLKAMNVPGNVSDIGPTSKAWLSASYQNIILYPRNTIKVNNIDSNVSSEFISAKKVRVKVITDGKNISFLLKWKDSTKSELEGCSSTVYGDGYALQFPTFYKDVKKLPYIDMGNSGRSVVVHVKKANLEIEESDTELYTQSNDSNQTNIDEVFEQYIEEIKAKIPTKYQRMFIAEGFYFIKEIKNDNTNIKMQMLYKNGYWRATLSRPLKSKYLNLDSDAFPVAFTLWDGDRDSENTVKLYSSWVGVKIVGKSGGEKFIDTFENDAKGDIRNGKKIAHEHCAVCHNYRDTIMAPAFMAPELTNVGGYATKEYLTESIVDPNAIIVEDRNNDEHKNFSWYSLDNKGSKISTMPSYDWMDQKSKDDLVAFFMTLKSEVK